jgi:protein-tyrosine phosphatase
MEFIPIWDLTITSAQQKVLTFHFIEKCHSSGRVLVHCKIGYSRSLAVMEEFLIRRCYSKNFPADMNLIRAARNSIVFRPEIWSLYSDLGKFYSQL